MPYTKENADLPSLVIIRPQFDAAGAVTGVSAQYNFVRRIKNDADANDQILQETKSVTIDLFDNAKSVTVPGLGAVTYRRIAQALKLVADAERALLP